jgi:hypothetical protein
LQDPISKIPITKKKKKQKTKGREAGGVAQGEGPEFKLQYYQKKRKS